MDLVIDHMLESLIKCRTKENRRMQYSASVSIVQSFVAVLLISDAVQIVHNLLDRQMILEWSGIAFIASNSTHFRQQTLNQMSDGHSRRNAVRIDNQVRIHAQLIEWHILRSVQHSTRPFLSMSRGKLVANLWHTQRSYAHFAKPTRLFIHRHHHHINNATLTRAQCCRRIAFALFTILIHQRIDLLLLRLIAIVLHLLWFDLQRRSLANDNIVARNTRSRAYQTIFVQFIVRSISQARSRLSRWLLKLFVGTVAFVLLFVVVRTIK
mmetsp:Transcript_18796/g.29913  ORF Transcript_18796/g.29913 Transcript_18796/m.29913 type:complete len:267 (+) Transcript_18796:525-1325(+)